MLDHGSFVISLDFEMMWGCHDWSTVEEYGTTNVRQVRSVISRLLELFHKYDIHATFATVGLIFCNNKEEILAYKPYLTPTYINRKRSPYREGYIETINSNDEYLFFAPDIIELLLNTPNIEIASHTFSHYFCWEKGQTKEQFEADLQSAISIAKKKGIVFNSIVLPRNEVSEPYLDICTSKGFVSYRGNAKKFFNNPSNRIKAIYYKVARLVDVYMNLGGNTSHSYLSLRTENSLINVPASRMLRPYMKHLRGLDCLRLRRITNEIQYAAMHHELYHLWWHPHNFGADMDENFHFLEKVLQVYEECKEAYNMHSYTMAEFANKMKH